LLSSSRRCCIALILSEVDLLFSANIDQQKVPANQQSSKPGRMSLYGCRKVFVEMPNALSGNSPNALPSEHFGAIN
jgi:hypothetical protein